MWRRRQLAGSFVAYWRGLFDRAFSKTGFCMVTVPQLTTGGDIHSWCGFAATFDGVVACRSGLVRFSSVIVRDWIVRPERVNDRSQNRKKGRPLKSVKSQPGLSPRLAQNVAAEIRCQAESNIGPQSLPPETALF